MNDLQKKRVWISLLASLILILGMFIGFRFHDEMSGLALRKGSGKLDQVMRMIQKKYVDSVDIKNLEASSIEMILSKLDPHSVFIPVEDLEEANESLEGNFEGIGIEFYLLHDTIYVVSAISGGPSEQLGIKAGDQIIEIDGKNVAGKKITNKDVMGSLRGPSGSKVQVKIKRATKKDLLPFTITRGNIPIHSVDVAYMAAPAVGLIKISSFGSNTHDEFKEALQKLEQAGAESLVIDLRGNPGGYLSAAIMICDELLPAGKLIVYTKGKSSPKREEFATSEGSFEHGKLIVLIDEGSASASEIVAGAVQDWDRGVIIGRRSFGKGLVQEQITMADGSSLRLTTARYYTPTGRCIQKPYSDDLGAYRSDIYNRYVHGELGSADSAKTSSKGNVFKTPGGKLVYDGGGISPDVFIGLDTSAYSGLYAEAVSLGLLNEYCYDWANRHERELLKYSNAKDFMTLFQWNKADWASFLEFCTSKGIKYNPIEVKKSEKLIKNQLKALVARKRFKSEGYWTVMHAQDAAVQKALELLQK